MRTLPREAAGEHDDPAIGIRSGAAGARRFGACSASAQEVTLKFSHFLGPKSFFQLDVVEPWAKELEARTNGKVKVETFDGTSPVGGVTEQASNVKAGKVDIALGLRGAEGDKFLGSSVDRACRSWCRTRCADRRRCGRCTRTARSADEYKDYKVLALFVHNPGLIHTKRQEDPRARRHEGRALPLAQQHGVRGARSISAPSRSLLQVNDVMAAVKDGKIDGIVTNWGNPLQGFNDFMKFHIETQFYTSAFFIVMNKAKYDGLPADIRAAIDAISGDAWVAKFGPYWDKWDRPVREGANAPGHEVIVPDAARMGALARGAQAGDGSVSRRSREEIPRRARRLRQAAATLRQ